MALQTQKSGKVSLLSDDLLCLIFARIKVKDDRKSCSEVCKQWLRVEGLNRSSLVVLRRHDFVITAIARFPNLVKFETWKPMSDTDLEFLAQACPKLETIKLNWREEYGVDCGVMSERGLRALGNGCPKLTKVCVFGEGRVGASGVAVLLHNAAKEGLCLGGNSLISDEALEAIGSALCFIDTLRLKDCRNIMDRGLGFLASGNTSQTLRKLNH